MKWYTRMGLEFLAFGLVRLPYLHETDYASFDIQRLVTLAMTVAGLELAVWVGKKTPAEPQGAEGRTMGADMKMIPCQRCGTLIPSPQGHCGWCWRPR